ELIREDRRDAERDRGRDLFFFELLERLDQGQVAVERALAEPHAAVRPAPVVQHVREVAVQGENKIHHGYAGWFSDGRSRLVHSDRPWTVCGVCASPGGREPPRRGGTRARRLRRAG